MKFAQQTFNVATKVTKDSEAINTEITLTESDVSDDVIAAALIAGNSPRVHWQSGARANGVPKTVTLSWSDWIGKPRRATVATRPMTAQEMLAEAKRDPDFAAKFAALLAAREE